MSPTMDKHVQLRVGRLQHEAGAAKGNVRIEKDRCEVCEKIRAWFIEPSRRQAVGDQLVEKQLSLRQQPSPILIRMQRVPLVRGQSL